MSLLSDLQTIAKSCGVPVETGVFSGKAPDTYLVITPLSDSFELHADNTPGCETQEARLSLFTKGSYTKLKNSLGIYDHPVSDFSVQILDLQKWRFIASGYIDPGKAQLISRDNAVLLHIEEQPLRQPVVDFLFKH